MCVAKYKWDKLNLAGFSNSKRGNFEEDDVQMPLKLVKELFKQQESTLKVFLSAFMDSVNTRIDNLMKDVQSVKSTLEFTQTQVEELILNLMLINLFIIVFILLVIDCVWQNTNEIN